MEKISNFFVFTWLIFAGLITYVEKLDIVYDVRSSHT